MATRKELDDFITGYNLRMKWNADIKKAMDEKFIADNDEVRDLIDDWLPTTIISEEDNNLPDVDVIDNSADPELYEYTDNNSDVVLELHTFSMTDCHHAYYRYKPNETEDEYKKKRMNFILNDVRKILNEYKKRISEMTKQTELFTKLEKMIAPSSNQIEKYVEVKKIYKVDNCNDCPYFKEIEDTSVCVDSFDEPNYDWYCTNTHADNKGTTLEQYNDKHGTSLGGSLHRGETCSIPDWCPCKNE